MWNRDLNKVLPPSRSKDRNWEPQHYNVPTPFIQKRRYCNLNNPRNLKPNKDSTLEVPKTYQHSIHQHYRNVELKYPKILR